MELMICLALGALIFGAFCWVTGSYDEPEGDKACQDCPEWSSCQGKNTDCWWRW